jgi:hypothetical protein
LFGPEYATVSNEILNLDILSLDLIKYNRPINFWYLLLYFIFIIKFIHLLWKSNMIKLKFSKIYKTLSIIFFETCTLLFESKWTCFEGASIETQIFLLIKFHHVLFFLKNKIKLKYMTWKINKLSCISWPIKSYAWNEIFKISCHKYKIPSININQ